MEQVHNERVKLTAYWLNTVAAIGVIAGGVIPAAAAWVNPPTDDTTLWMLRLLLWMLGGTAAHLAARSVLGRLR